MEGGGPRYPQERTERTRLMNPIFFIIKIKYNKIIVQ